MSDVFLTTRIEIHCILMKILVMSIKLHFKSEQDEPQQCLPISNPNNSQSNRILLKNKLIKPKEINQLILLSLSS